MALTAKQQQFLNTYVRKHALKGKAKAKRAEGFSSARQPVIDLVKRQPWLLVDLPAFRTRLEAAESLGDALKFDRAAAGMTQLLADMQQAVRNHPTGGDPTLAQPGNPVMRTLLRNDRDGIVNAPGWANLVAGPLGTELRVLKGRIAAKLDQATAPTVAQLNEARSLVNELKVKTQFVRDRLAEIEKRREQLRKYAGQLQQGNALSVEAMALAGKDAGTWTREDESKATEVYLKMMLDLSEHDQVGHKNYKAGSTQGEIVLAVRRKYKVDNQGQDLPDVANFKLVVKPLTNEIDVPGFKAGGGAGREVMGSVIGDKLQEMLGFDLNVAKTRLAKIDGAKIGVQGGGDVCASVQAFVKNGNTALDDIEAMNRNWDSMDERFEAGAAILDNKGVTQDEVHSKAVFDLLSLHLDRHMGNFIIDPSNKLVPIDHGNILPSRAGLRARSEKMLPPEAVLATTAAAQQKLSPEMIERIERLNIDELVQTMKTAKQEMATNTPEALQGDLDADLDEGINNAKRSAEFLKFAARQLTLADIYKTYGTYYMEIFCSEEDEKLAAFATAVAGTVESNLKFALQGLNQTYGDVLTKAPDRMKLLNDLKALGWFTHVQKAENGTFKRFVKNYPERCAAILNQHLRAPDLPLPKPVPAWTGTGPQPGSWEPFWALGGLPAAKRYGFGDGATSGAMREELYIPFAVSGRKP